MRYARNILLAIVPLLLGFLIYEVEVMYQFYSSFDLPLMLVFIGFIYLTAHLACNVDNRIAGFFTGGGFVLLFIILYIVHNYVVAFPFFGAIEHLTSYYTVFMMWSAAGILDGAQPGLPDILAFDVFYLSAVFYFIIYVMFFAINLLIKPKKEQQHSLYVRNY